MNTINKKIVCLTDRDPERKKKEGKYNFQKCYPFEFNCDSSIFEYQNNLSLNKYKPGTHPNIALFSQDAILGRTFEYDLILANPTLELLITESMVNASEMKTLMKLYDDEEPLSKFLEELRKSDENKRIVNSINLNTTWTEDQKIKSIIAARYLNSVGKGENALELAYVLEENLMKKGTAEYKEFTVPDYIKDAIEWICI